ncbi:proline--tRNA ligase [Alphaproteobacteria bacterium]|nr:proline--tRNA ligase [Alphaproteobacteria bacterium]MDC1023234.1 proline--tRNA ligase [Alphaproteobacteria bacterium]
MLLSHFFLPILKESPKEAEIASHVLMLRSGMIQQSSSGIYSWLPLGKIILDKITSICNNEMINAGCNEILMPTLQSADIWRESGRYEDYGKEMLRIVDRNQRDLLYGPTNEELVTEIFRTHIKSYKELPLKLFHSQWKFRDELRPRFGVMRGREFLMKDAYSFDVDQGSSIISYNKMFVAYMQLFKKMGLKAIPMKADTGPIGGDLSHEFIIMADTGESEVFLEKDFLNFEGLSDNINYNENLQEVVDKYTSFYAATEEKHNPDNFTNHDNDLIKARGIEVGHIFHFGQKYSKPMKAFVNNDQGKNIPVYMGSYGVGLSRLVGAIIEANHDKNGIIWPKEITPWNYNIINLKNGDDDCDKICSDLYSYMNKNADTVLYDDTNDRAGAKLAKADLIGLPYQIIIGPNGIKDQQFDLKNRKNGDLKKMSYNELLNFLNSKRH